MEQIKGNTLKFPEVKQASGASPLRARTYNIKAKPCDMGQYKRAALACSDANLSFELIAGSAEFLGDEVVRQEIDASVQLGWQNTQRESAENEHRILLWQNRGEKVTIDRQLTASESGKEIIQISDYLPQVQTPQQTIEVVEGLNVTTNNPQTIPVSSNNPDLENNPYLQMFPGDIKKAA